MRKDVTKIEEKPTGLENVPISDASKAPRTVVLGQKEEEYVQKKTLICDVFAGYSEVSGNARFDQTFQRDIISYYKMGHMVHATAATHNGEPVPIGQDAASATTSEYDTQRLERLSKRRAAEQARKAEEAAAAAREHSEAASSSATPAPAATAEGGSGTATAEGGGGTATAEGGGGKLKKRASAGTTRGAPAAAAADGGAPVGRLAVDTDRRGKLTLMRLVLKMTDGCGVQYVQREAALGTAALYGDIEALSQQATEAVARFGVIGLHVVCEVSHRLARDSCTHVRLAATWRSSSRARAPYSRTASSTYTTPRARSSSTTRTRA